MIPSIIVPVKHREIMSALKTLRVDNRNLILAFEKKISEYIDCENVLLTSSGRTALYLLLRAYGLRKGDEVILPAYGCESVTRLVIDMGYRVRFVDVDRNTYNMSIEDLNGVISYNTKAVLAIHMFGIPCDMDGIKEVAGDYHAVVIEDSAQTIGAEYHGKKAGTVGDCGFFSFGTAKSMTTMDGGVAVSKDKEIMKIARKMAENFKPNNTQKIKILMKLMAYSFINHPVFYAPVYNFIINRRIKRRCSLEKEVTNLHDFEHAYTDMQAAVGMLQLSKLNLMNSLRVKNTNFLIKHLGDLKNIHMPEIPDNVKPVFLRFPVWIEGMDLKMRDELIHIMRLSGIDTPVAYPNVLPRFFNLNTEKNYPNAEELVKKTITLPVHPLIKMKHLNTIVDVLATFEEKYF